MNCEFPQGIYDTTLELNKSQVLVSDLNEINAAASYIGQVSLKYF